MRSNISCIFNFSVGAALAFKGLITLLHSELALSKVSNSTPIFLNLGSDAILSTAEVNLSKEKRKKNSEVLFRALYNFSK